MTFLFVFLALSVGTLAGMLIEHLRPGGSGSAWTAFETETKTANHWFGEATRLADELASAHQQWNIKAQLHEEDMKDAKAAFRVAMDGIARQDAQLRIAIAESAAHQKIGKR